MELLKVYIRDQRDEFLSNYLQDASSIINRIPLKLGFDPNKKMSSFSLATRGRGNDLRHYLEALMWRAIYEPLKESVIESKNGSSITYSRIK